MTEATSVSPDTLRARLAARLDEALVALVPWFLEQMPRAYFLDTDEATRTEHLIALLAARGSGLAHRMRLESEDGAVVTFLETEDYPGLLSELVAQLPRDRPLTSAKVHSAADESLVLDVFRFGDRRDRFDPSDPTLAAKLEATLAHAASKGDDLDETALLEGFSACSAEYLRTVPPARLYENHRLWLSVRGTEHTVVRRSPRAEPGRVRLAVATGEADARSLFERVVWLLGRRGVQIGRAFLDLFDGAGQPAVAVLGFVVTEQTCPSGVSWEKLERDLARLRWLDERVLRLHALQEGLTLLEAEVLVGISDLAHAKLAREEPFGFSRDRIFERLERHPGVTKQISRLFLRRFDPDQSISDEDFDAGVGAIRTQIEREVDAEADRRFFETALDASRATLRCNVYVPTRYGLALRIDPSFFAHEQRPADPYGVFFVHGRGFDAFHVRFADIARGGVRVVRPKSPEQHELEAERIFEEAYGLAFAQQLKNKDIPEGGSKAVILAEPDAPVDLSVKAFADGLLDLLTPDPEVRARVRDRFGIEELLYLGPDENISPELIEWVVERARRRGYPLPDAFMSSKPGAGINHKEYGVTSEGVTVFLEEALLSVGIDPRKQAFTVKLTGGPDGDVAGNELKILHREYGDHAKIVGIADGSGSARDPDGIDMRALLALVEADEPIAALDPSALGPRGQLLALSAPDGIRARNNLCFEVVADAFVPAGGRPATIHAKNWSKFLGPDGTPSSRVIVEGANLFITPEARRALGEKAGVVIVKDSSANKCGVICSSYEITASMMLTPQEFIEVKPVFVREVLDRLRELGRREAKVLFSAKSRAPGALLPELSVALSKTVLRATEAIRAGLRDLDVASRALADQLVIEHLPPVLVERYSDRIVRLPVRYREGIVASSLATRIVYGEGLGFLAEVPDAGIAQLAIGYLKGAREAERLAEVVLASELPDKARVAELLRRGGARAGLEG